MGNYNIFQNVIREIPTNLRRYIVRKLRRFNIIPRAHKVIEKTAAERGERAPLPHAIQQKIDEALKNEPELLKSVSSDRNETLLERLKKVFVSSTGENKDMFDKSRLTPTQYNLFKQDLIEEFKENIPEGKFSLQQAEIFLREFQRDPDIRAVESLSEKLKIEPKNMMFMLTHTKLFKVALPITRKTEARTLLQKTTDAIVPSIIETEPDEEKMYRLLETRGEKFRQFYREKLGLQEAHPIFYVKSPVARKVLVNMKVMTKEQLDTKVSELNKSVVQVDATVPSDEKETVLLVKDLKPGEDPNALEEIEEHSSEQLILKVTKPDPTSTGETHESIKYPSDYTFDVFKVMEEQDRKARNEERRKKRKQREEEELERAEEQQKSGTNVEKISSENP